MQLGNAKINFLGHSGFLIELAGKRIVVDPFQISPGIEKADIILISHGHYDHCSIKDIEQLIKEGTILVITPDCQSKITRLEKVEMQLVEPGDTLELGPIKIETVPAYCIGKQYHPKSEGFVGYLIKQNGTVIYHAGDTDKIPEMEKLAGYGKKDSHFIALLPISGKYVMTADEAAEAASLLNANLSIPMHYGSGVIGTIEDANKFVKACEQLSVKALILEKI